MPQKLRIIILQSFETEIETDWIVKLSKWSYLLQLRKISHISLIIIVGRKYAA
jgi:hypothetical protein